MKKFLIYVMFTLTTIIIYFLQENFFSFFNIAGIRPNLFVIFILYIGLFTNRTVGTVSGVIIGFITDCLVEKCIGVNAILFGTIGFLSAVFDKNFSKDSRITIMMMVLGTTVLYEILHYFAQYLIFSINVEILSFIKILIVEVIFNLILAIIIYPIMKKTGYYIENEYKGNKILTRYF